VDDRDATPPASFGPQGADADWRVAALRELIEETGIWLTTDGARAFPLVSDAYSAVEESSYELDQRSLIYFSNWITPSVFPIRFNTRFFLAVCDGDFQATYSSDELIDLAWVSPKEALHRVERATWVIAFPTRKTLEMFATESSPDALADRLRSIDIISPIEPRLYVNDSEAGILLPDDPDFAAAGPAQRDPTLLDRLQQVVERGGRVPAEFRRRS